MKISSGDLAMVTGAGSGIGQALAYALDAAGCQLAVCDLSEASLEPLITDGLDVVASAAVDVCDQAGLEGFIGDVVERFGPPAMLLNNAGTSLCQRFENVDFEAFRRVMDVNFWGMVYGTKAVLPAMQAAERGTIVFISSIFGVVGVPTQTAYNASKFAIRGFAESLREELADSPLEVLVVHPGGVRTNIIRNARVDDWPLGNADPVAQFDRHAATTADEAAAQIVAAIVRGDRRLLIGRDARWLDRLQRLFPARYWQVLRALRR